MHNARARLQRARIASCLAIVTCAAVVLPGLTRAEAAFDPRHVGITLATIARGLASPVGIAAPNDGTGRLFVIEQAGRIRVYLPRGGLQSTPYLDIRSRVLSGGERGLLGLAFHPNFKTNGYFYVHYTTANGDIHVSRFHATPSRNQAASNSEQVLMTIPHQTYGNHNGGQLAFGGGYLHIGIGDGGGAGDPSGNAQNLNSWLGKVLRIDVDHSCGSLHYCIPSTNPFASRTGVKHEIWLYGLRNPWRFSFDSRYPSGSLFIGDVGQSAREEIDITPGGRNMGWDCREGTLNTVSSYGGSYCNGVSFTGPIYQYSHASGRCAVVGGFVYRGATYASVMAGVYLYADYCTGEIWGLAHQTNGSWLNALLRNHSASITSFGHGPTGELYIVDTSGILWHIKGYRR
ncbi:MAG: PQQ-dependent sugar dehydrogenase [Actinomycetota bacterium]